jgi:cellulose synthase operon protein C
MTSSGHVWRTGLGLALAGALSLSACRSPEQQAAHAHARFQVLYDAGDYSRARVEINKALRYRDDQPGYWIDLAHAELALGNFPGAYIAYSRALELDRNNVEALTNAGDIALAGNLIDSAEDYTTRLLAIDPSNARGRLVKGSLLLKKKDYKGALAIGQQLLAEAPDAEGVLLLVARAQFEQGDRAAAITTLQNAVDRRGGTIALLERLVDYQRQAGDQQALARNYAAYTRLKPDDVGLQFDYARQLQKIGDSAGARQVIAGIDEKYRNDVKVQGAVLDFIQQSQGVDRAIAEAQRRAGQGALPIKAAMAAFLLDRGRADLAQSILQPQVANIGTITPDTVEAASVYAAAMNARGQGDAALSLANRVLAFDDSQPRMLLMRSEIYRQRGKLDEALADAQLLTHNAPQLEGGWIALAKAYVARGDHELAEQTFVRAMQDFPKSAAVSREYALYRVSRGNMVGAFIQAQGFVRANPNNLDGLKLQAELCQAIGNGGCVSVMRDRMKQLPGGAAAAGDLRDLAAGQKQITLPPDLEAMARAILVNRLSILAASQGLAATGRADAAKLLVQSMMQRQPGNSLNYVAQANLAARAKDAAGAQAQFRDIIRRFPAEPRGYIGLGWNLLNAGDAKGAFATMAAGRKQLPDDPLLLAELGMMHARNKENRQAIDSLRAAVQLAPRALPFVYSLANLLGEQNSQADLLEAERTVLALAGQDIAPFNDMRGWIQFKLGRIGQALPLLRRAVAQDGRTAIYHYHLGAALAAKGDRAAARTEIATALAATGKNDSWTADARKILMRP